MMDSDSSVVAFHRVRGGAEYSRRMNERIDAGRTGLTRSGDDGPGWAGGRNGSPFKRSRHSLGDEKDAYDREDFVWPAAGAVAETRCSPSSTSGSLGATVARSARLPVSGSVK